MSEHLEINPCATFAVFCLWNTTIKPNTPLDNRNVGPDQIASKYSFTGTKDEEWFYVVSAAIEVQGGGLISLLLEAINAVQSQNARRLAQLLTRISPHLREISHILERMYEKCSPEVFYRQLRPFLAGSSKMSEAGLPQGIFYEDANGHGEWRTYSGGSNAQSSLIQLCDIVLGLDQSKANFTEEMRNYMPGAHKRFLEFMSRASTVREFIKSATEDLTLSEAYNDAVLQLVSIRTQHIQMVSRYILVPASDERQAGHNPRIGHTKGTGGTTLMPFLKLARDTTKEAVQFVPEVV